MSGTAFFRSEIRVRAALRAALGLFLVFPFLIWFWRIEDWGMPDGAELFSILCATWNQSGLSTLFSFFLGLLLFFSVRAMSSAPGRRVAEALLIFPNLVPPLFLGLSYIWVAEALGIPSGLTSVVLIHSLLNAGLAALALERIYQRRVAGVAEAAWVTGASRGAFWFRIAAPLMRADSAYLILFLFSLHITSFSLPLLVGGDRVLTMEVAIYDAIRVDGRWDVALFMAALQTLALLFFAWALPKSDVGWRSGGTESRAYRPTAILIPAVLLPISVFGTGFFLGSGQAVKGVWSPELNSVLGSAALASLSLGLIVGLLHLVFFLIVAYVTPHRRLEKFLLGYLAPSPAITGFGFLLLPIRGETARLFQCAVALTLLSAPLLYRWLVYSEIKGVERQVNTARTLGASAFTILTDVLWPQISPALLRASGLAALWAAGDFAVSGIIFGGEATLALVIQNLMNNYRLDTAQILLGPLLLICLSLYAFFAGAGRYVAR